MKLKPEFINRARELLGSEAEEYLKIIEEPLKESFRVNTLKINVKELINRLESKGWVLRKIPWCAEGYVVLNGPPKIANTLEHFMGYIYKQGPASMIPPLMMELSEGLKVLDMTASPGSKTGQIAGLMNDNGLIIANDVRIDRTSILKVNLQRMGVKSVIITRRNGINFSRNPEFFDRVLIDAPCSSEGVIRKKPYIAQEWNHKELPKFARVQKALIMAAYDSLKKGGIMIYSTCSLSPEENEEIIQFLLDKTSAKLLPAELKGLKSRKGIINWKGKELNKEVTKCARVYPHDNDTEGFFIAKVMKQ